jgi:hypothetical protein
VFGSTVTVLCLEGRKFSHNPSPAIPTPFVSPSSLLHVIPSFSVFPLRQSNAISTNRPLPNVLTDKRCKDRKGPGMERHSHKKKYGSEINVPVPLRSAQISHGITRDHTRVSTLQNQNKCTLYIKIHFVPHNEQSAISLQRPISECC